MEQQTNLIDQLGGYRAVASELGQNETTVSNWRARGVPWRWRPVVAQLAKRKKVVLPADFLQPKVA